MQLLIAIVELLVNQRGLIQARENLTGGPVLQNDETGSNVGGKLRWLHSPRAKHSEKFWAVEWAGFQNFKRRSTCAIKPMI